MKSHGGVGVAYRLYNAFYFACFDASLPVFGHKAGKTITHRLQNAQSFFFKNHTPKFPWFMPTKKQRHFVQK